MTAGTPRVATSAIEDAVPVDIVGAVRRFRLADGSEFCEQLLSLSDDKRLTYCLLEAPVPLMGYIAMIRLKPGDRPRCTFWEWRSEFHPPEHRREELTALVRDSIYPAGFAAIRQFFGGGVQAGGTELRLSRRAAGRRHGLERRFAALGRRPTRAIVVAHTAARGASIREVVLPASETGRGAHRPRRSASTSSTSLPHRLPSIS